MLHRARHNAANPALLPVFALGEHGGTKRSDILLQLVESDQSDERWIMTRRGELERAVIDVLWDAGGDVTARTVAVALVDRGLALTTVLTVLARLEDKGLVTRSRDGRAHTYRATATRAEHSARLMNQVLQDAGDRQDALVHFIGTVSDDDLAALRRALDER